MNRLGRRLTIAFLSVGLIAAAAPPTVSTSDPTFDAMTARIKAGMLTDPAKVIDDAKVALAHARRVDSPTMEATALWLLGEANSRVIEPERAVRILGEAQRIVEKAAPGTQLNADILLSQGGARYATGEVGPALSDLRRAHDMFRDSGDTRSQAKALIMIALVHTSGNDHAGALRYFGQAMEAFRADPGLSLAIYNGRGKAFKELKKLREAEAEMDKALVVARGMNSAQLYVQVLGNIADVRLAKKDLAGAERAISEGLAKTVSPDTRAYNVTFIGLAADVALERGQLERARRLIEQRFSNIDLSTTLLTDRPAHDVAYRLYTRLDRSDLALPHLAALKRLDELATATVRSNSAAIAAAQFDFANQELQIAQLKASDLQKTVAFEREQARTQRMVFGGLAGATLLIIAMLAAWLLTMRRSRNALARSNTALGKALAAKTEFLATTSHEIRTPLNGILGMTQVMLADRKTDDATRERLSVVHSAGITMRALVDDILDVAKIETGKMTIEEAPTNVRQTILDAARMWQDQARAKGLLFTIDISNGPDWALSDATRLRQIVFNLLSNAVKFTPSGQVDVTATTEGDRWSLVVKDSGIGISAEKHELIFEAFRQADTGTTRQFGGTGLGLSICRNLSRAMGGDVTVRSEEGGGATFVLDLPYVPAEPAGQGEASGGGNGVLVVDRNPITRAMFKALLSPVGGAVSFAGTPAEGTQALAGIRPDTILIEDATLRTADDHCGAVRSIASAAAPGATIALLGPPIDDENRRELSEAGVTRFITKPIGKEALVEALFSDERRVIALVSEAA